MNPQDFLKRWGKLAQDYATQTNQYTDLLRGKDGVPRMVLRGWPIQGGIRLGTYKPLKERAS